MLYPRKRLGPPDKAAAEAPLGASAPAGPARSVLPVHDEPDRGRKPLPADGSAAAVSGEKLGREKMQFVDRVSDVLREYLGARFASGLLLCDGLETTSNEMIQILREARVGTELLREIAEFLFRCDLVKFAKVVPDQKQVEAILAKAREVVQVSTPPLAPANPNPENRAESPRDKP